jgi:hypothetical protein
MHERPASDPLPRPAGPKSSALISRHEAFTFIVFEAQPGPHLNDVLLIAN